MLSSEYLAWKDQLVESNEIKLNPEHQREQDALVVYVHV